MICQMGFVKPEILFSWNCICLGTSISPDVDVGQVEGGLIMGLGLWTSEQV